MTIERWQVLFTDKVQKLMQDKNIKPARLADSTGISRGRLSEYLNMKSMPTIFAIINIADVFDVSVRELIDFGERIENYERKVM